MIIKKKNIPIKYLGIINKIFSKFIYFIGIFFLSLFLLIFIYYSTSGIKDSFTTKEFIKKVDRVIFDKYTGFSIFEIDDYFFIKIKSLKYLLIKNDLENVKVSINQENLYTLELERKSKLEDKFFKFTKFADAQITKDDENFRIKMRLKGDRSIHWANVNQTSYKIDLKGEKRLWGMEEFSVQKPVARNYIYEFIFHKLLEINNLISLKYFFINLSLNDSDQGIFAVEEGFSKELIERNKKRNGPIFGIEEKEGIEYPNIIYDLYSKNYWMNNYPDLTKKAFAKLNLVKTNDEELEKYFDIEKWAKFFAVVDFSNALHGSLTKSVKLYYNTTTGKFEPIGFDGHYYELNPANNFIILDFLNSKNNNCNHICYDRNWYLKFLKDGQGNLNHNFINLYLKELTQISSDTFLEKFNKQYSNKINFYNAQFFSEKSNKDRGLYKGLGYFIYDNDYLEKRKRYIQKRIKNLDNIEDFKISLDNDKIKFYSKNKSKLKRINIECGNNSEIKYIYSNSIIKFKQNCNYLMDGEKLNVSEIAYLNSNIKEENFFDLVKEHNLIFKDNKYFLNNDLIITKNVYFPKNEELVIKDGTKIFFKNRAIFLSEGSINFEGTKENPIIVNGNKSGSIILRNNDYKIRFTELENLTNPNLNDKILHGGINIIESNLDISNLSIRNSLSEDAINIISSVSNVDNLKVSETFSDAIDVDFGKINFQKIYCKNVNNDCFDISGGNVKGEYLEATNISDKGISFGEESIGKINLVNLKKNYLAIAVKDGSNLFIEESNLTNNNFDVSVFKKKSEFGNAKLVLNETNNPENLKALIGKKNEFLSGKVLNYNKVNNNFIYNLFY